MAAMISMNVCGACVCLLLQVQMQVGLRDKFGQWWGEDDNTAYGPAVTSCRVAVDEGS